MQTAKKYRFIKIHISCTVYISYPESQPNRYQTLMEVSSFFFDNICNSKTVRIFNRYLRLSVRGKTELFQESHFLIFMGKLSEGSEPKSLVGFKIPKKPKETG